MHVDAVERHMRTGAPQALLLRDVRDYKAGPGTCMWALHTTRTPGAETISLAEVLKRRARGCRGGSLPVLAAATAAASGLSGSCGMSITAWHMHGSEHIQQARAGASSPDSAST